jgi:hypothetical protein
MYSSIILSPAPHAGVGGQRNQVSETAATCSSWFFARGFFYPEVGGDMFIRNVGSHKIPEDGILHLLTELNWYIEHLAWANCT